MSFDKSGKLVVHYSERLGGDCVSLSFSLSLSHTHTHTHSHSRTNTHTQTRTHTYANQHTNTYTHKHTHTHTFTHTHTHTHTRSYLIACPIASAPNPPIVFSCKSSFTTRPHTCVGLHRAHSMQHVRGMSTNRRRGTAVTELEPWSTRPHGNRTCSSMPRSLQQNDQCCVAAHPPDTDARVALSVVPLGLRGRTRSTGRLGR